MQVTQHLAFCDWILPLNVLEDHRCCNMYQYIMPFNDWISIFHLMDIPQLFHHSSVHGPLVCFHFRLLWIVLLWICVYKYLNTCFHSIGCKSFLFLFFLNVMRRHLRVLRKEAWTHLHFSNTCLLLLKGQRWEAEMGDIGESKWDITVTWMRAVAEIMVKRKNLTYVLKVAPATHTDWVRV